MFLTDFIFKTLFTLNDNKRDRGLTTPDDVTRHDSIPYGPDGVWNLLDVYTPKGGGFFPTLVHIHGGGYVYGDKERYQFYCMELTHFGFGVVSFNYHLAPRSTYPTPLRDTELVLRWVSEHGAEYGLTTDSLYLMGDSAGAQLASQYAAAWSDPAYARMLGLTPPPIKIRAVGLNCGMYDAKASAKGQRGILSITRSYFRTDVPDLMEQLDVLAHITPDFPPAYLISAPGDFLAANCRPMGELLASKGVDAAWKLYGDKKTGHVFHLDVRSELARQANLEEAEWLLKH